MLRSALIRKDRRRYSLPTSLRGLRAAYTADSLSRSSVTNTDTAGSNIDDAAHQTAIEAFQLLLDSQRTELAEKDAALAALNKREITVSTVAIEKLTGLPTFKSVESWALQFVTNEHLEVLKNMAVESRQAIEYEANTRGLTVGDEWTTLPKCDILLIIKACFPQKEEGQELSSTQHIEKMKSSAHLFFPGEKGGPKFIQASINFCNLLPESKIHNITLQKSWVAAIWDKIPSNMKIKAALKEQVKACETVKSFIYLMGKYNFDIAEQNVQIVDNGFIVTPDPKFGFFYNSKRKDVNGDGDGKFNKNLKNDSPLPPVHPCDVCGRSTDVRVKGKPATHTNKNCFCRNHCDKNVTNLSWSKSPNGLTFKSLGLNSLPHNKKLSGDRKSLVDYTLPPVDKEGKISYNLMSDSDLSL
jgi:hypothetical protein